jgi:uncharacterized protein YpmB
MEQKRGKGKIFLVIGIVLIISSLFFFLQVSGIKAEAEEIAKINEVRASVRLEKANLYTTLGIIWVVLGGASLVIGIIKNKQTK